MNTRKWSDIGYNFLVGEDGNVYEGRGWGKTGAHTVGYNSKSVGICFIGNFESTYVHKYLMILAFITALKFFQIDYPTQLLPKR